MQHVTQSPSLDAFVQNPYPFYDRLRPLGELVWWQEYDMPVAARHATVAALLRDKRFGREDQLGQQIPDHLAPFYAIEAHSMLQLDPPRHTRLRGLVLRAFTSRRIAALEPEIIQLCHDLIDDFPPGPFDLLTHYAQKLPVIIITRLLGVPSSMSGQLLAWSNAMVGMYQAKRTRVEEDRAVAAGQEFTAFLLGYIAKRRTDPRDDLITHLIAANEDGAELSTDELIANCILLLNAGHEATVHTLGNAIHTCLTTGTRPTADTKGFVEEALRHDPPLHMFTRFAINDVEIYGHQFKRGDEVGLLLGAANRDPEVYPLPELFNPDRNDKPHTSLGGGIHFCVGAPLARIEVSQAIAILFDRCPRLLLSQPARYADIYHFHGLERLTVECPKE